MPDDIPQIKPSKADNVEIPKVEIVDTMESPHEESKMSHSKFAFMKKLKLKKPQLKLPRMHMGRRGAIILGTVLTSFFLIIFLGILFGVLPSLDLYKESKVLMQSAQNLKGSTSSKDITVIESEYANFKSEFLRFESKFNKVYWMRRLPFVGVYVEDARHGLNAGLIALDTGDIALETIKPYADIIGLGGTDSAGTETANDRIEFLVNTIDDILPRLDEVNANIVQIQAEVDKIDVSKYPEEFQGRKIREPLTDALQALDEGADFLVESKPLIEKASYLLGVEDQRKYLLLFQNDKELRATGGFITAYSIINVTNGKIENVRSSDIYDLDSNYTPSIEAPDPIKEYLKGPYLLSDNFRLRDINWNPDFKESISLFLEEAASAGIEDVDGVIAVDTQVVVNLLNAIGPIGVPGYGDFSTNNDERCDCPQVIYELEAFADVEGPVVWNQDGSGEIIYAPENYGQRKEIIGPLMNSVLTNALGQPKEKMTDLFEAAWRSISEKHVLVYLLDEEAQSGAEGANLAGRIDQDFQGDYLHVNDSNLGGRKSNLYVTHEVAQDVEISRDGSVTKTVVITYANPKDYDGWLNSVLPNWTRVYVPQGAELIDSDGFETDAEVYDELGKTVFAGGFQLRPQGIKKVTLTYKLPQKFDSEYTLLVQKQPGKDFILHTITVGNKTQELFLRTDKEFTIKL